MKIIKIITISILLFGGLINFALAATPSVCHTLEIKLPGFLDCVKPADYLSSLYKLSLGIGVFLAAVVIVIAGIKYAISGDNAGQQKEAREDIYQAIFGLLILFGSVIILKTINPDLADLSKWQNLPKIETSDFINTVGPECAQAINNRDECFREKDCSGSVVIRSAKSTGICTQKCVEKSGYEEACGYKDIPLEEE